MTSWGNLQPLSPEFYTLLRYGLFLVLFIHIPYIGVLVGGSTVSLLLGVLGKEKRASGYLRFSQEVMKTVWTGKTAFLMFGFVPILIVWAIYTRIFFGESPLPWPFWSAILAFLFIGFALLQRYRSARERSSDLLPFRFGAGASGLLAVLFAFFLFSGAYGILFNPEKLPLLRKEIGFFLSWNAVVKFLLFLSLFFGMTGGLILVLGGRMQEETREADAGHREFVRDVGATLTWIASLVLPVLLLFDLVTLPRVALSAGVFATSAVILILGLAVCLTLSRAHGPGGNGMGRPVPALVILIFLAMLVHDHMAVGNAYQDRIAFLGMQAEAAATEPAAEAPPKEPATAARAVEEAGEAVFKGNCAGCHRFDIRVVGPPLNERVPKYGGDVEKLKSFIRKPVKVAPDYPPMPALGLPEEEIDAVARYLIGKMRGGGSE